jgi:hypothetical protein
MRKYLLPSILILLLGLSYTLAQTITRALQLSQDTTGAFSVDTNNGVYFPGHILSTGTNRPAPTVAGTGSTPTIASTSTDNAGTITAGTLSTVINLTFGQPWVSTPNCVVTAQSGGTPVTYTPVTTSLAITQGATTGNKLGYICLSPS